MSGISNVDWNHHQHQPSPWIVVDDITWTVTRAGAGSWARSPHEMDHKRYYSDSKKGNVFSLHVSGFKSQMRMNKEQREQRQKIER